MEAYVQMPLEIYEALKHDKEYLRRELKEELKSYE